MMACCHRPADFGQKKGQRVGERLLNIMPPHIILIHHEQRRAFSPGTLGVRGSKGVAGRKI